jgi:hypothetical protein
VRRAGSCEARAPGLEVCVGVLRVRDKQSEALPTLGLANSVY